MDEKKIKELLTLTIELGDKSKKYLKIYIDSSPEELAYNFCKENQLDYNSLKNLTNEIKEVIYSAKNNSSLENTQSTQSPFLILENDQKIKKDINENIPKYNFKNISFLLKNFKNSKIKNYNRKNKNIKNPYNKFKKSFSFNRKSSTSKNSYINCQEIIKKNYLLPTKSSKSKNKKIHKSKSMDDFSKNNTNFTINSNDNDYYLNKNIYLKELKYFTDNINYNIKKNKTEKLVDRLYYNQILNKAKNTQKLKEKFEKDKKVIKYTFQPKINKINKNSLYFRTKNNLIYNNKYQTLHYNDYKDSIIQKNRDKFLIEEEKDLTFCPKINPNNKTKNAIPVYEKLYNYKTVNLEQKFYDKKNLFKPKTNKKTNQHILGSYQNLSFNERQKIFASKSKSRINKLYAQLNEGKDKYFKPSINTNYNNILSRNCNVFFHLYGDFQKNKTKKEKIIRSNSAIFNNKFKINFNSANMVKDRKYKIFKKFFEILDNSGKKIISKKNIINQKFLPTNVRKIIEPILSELNKSELNLNLKEFVNACNILYETLDYDERKCIYNFNLNDYNNTKKNKSFSFRPKNKKNSKLNTLMNGKIKRIKSCISMVDINKITFGNNFMTK